MPKKEPWEDQWKVIGEAVKGGQGTAREVSPLSDPSIRRVLKKLLNNKPQHRRRMHQEVTSLRLLASAGVKVPRVLAGNTDQFEDENVPLYFVMELIPGNTLEKEVENRGGLRLEQAVAIGLDICSTVKAAHAENVLHRDLKPDNIILRSFEAADAVIVDFGLSFNEEGEGSITQTGENFRNKFLSLPETNTSEGDRRDKRSDITAICGVFYYCLTGGVPGQLLDGKGLPPHKRDKHSVREALDSDPRREQIELLLDRGFAVQIENRFQTVDELVGRLRGILEVADKPKRTLAQVVAEQKVRLRRFDRKTQLIEFAGHTGLLENHILERVQAIQTDLAPYVMSAGLASIEMLPSGIDKVADLPAVSISVPGHPYSGQTFFVVGARGDQCVLLQKTIIQEPSQQLNETSDLKEVIWYNPNHPPDANKLSACVDDAVATMIEQLTDKTVGSGR